MPDADDLRTHLQSVDFSDLPTLTPSALRQLNDVVDVDIHKVRPRAKTQCCFGDERSRAKAMLEGEHYEVSMNTAVSTILRRPDLQSAAAADP